MIEGGGSQPYGVLGGVRVDDERHAVIVRPASSSRIELLVPDRLGGAEIEPGLGCLGVALETQAAVDGAAAHGGGPALGH